MGERRLGGTATATAFDTAAARTAVRDDDCGGSTAWVTAEAMPCVGGLLTAARA
jgi:hypothetical protein